MEKNVIVEIAKIEDISKYAKFTLTDGTVHVGKYGYFSYIAYNLIGENEMEFPVKVKLDFLGVDYFHVEAILHKGLWVKVKPRGF